MSQWYLDYTRGAAVNKWVRECPGGREDMLRYSSEDKVEVKNTAKYLVDILGFPGTIWVVKDYRGRR